MSDANYIAEFVGDLYHALRGRGLTDDQAIMVVLRIVDKAEAK